MATNLINYRGIIQWKEQNYYNPIVYYNDRLIPYHNDLVVVKSFGLLIVVPYSNQDRILGVVTKIQESTATVNLDFRLRVE